MLIFSKTSIQSSDFDLIDVFMFPAKDVKKTYENNKNEKCFLFQNLTETDSTSVFFIFVSTPSTSLIHAEKAIDVIFDVLIKSKILERLNFSDDFWERFCVHTRESTSRNTKIFQLTKNIKAWKKYPQNGFWSIFREISNIVQILFWQ